MSTNSLVTPAGKTRDVERYRRFLDGETAQEIAVADGVAVQHVEKSIRQGMLNEQARGQAALIKMQTDAAVELEQLRKKVRDELSKKVPKAIDTLLTGERTVVSKGEKGQLHVETYTDPDIIALGLQEFRKTVSMEQKPGPAVTITNISQTNVQNNSGGGDGFDFESALEHIRKEQSRVIDVGRSEVRMEEPAEPEEVTPAPEVDNREPIEIVPEPAVEPAGGKWEDF